LRYRVLGPPEVSTPGHPLDLGGTLQRGLLAVLLLHTNRVISRERLIALLWEANPPDTARANLQGRVTRLRRGSGRSTPAARSSTERRFRAGLDLWRGRPGRAEPAS
jgi:DNA-binding SARP family transcriptional activator